MKRFHVALALGLLLSVAFMLSAQAVYPRVSELDPSTAKAGDAVVVTGQNLDKANVAEVYLSDGEKDTKVAVTDQAAESLKIKVPDSLKAGRFSLVLLTTTKPAKLMVQPVRLTIE
jgi:hypothetical protein